MKRNHTPKATLIFLLVFMIWTDKIKATNYYVNDGSNTGNVYTTAVGTAGNNGLSPATPKNSIQAIITTYALTGGDFIYIDPGTYIEEVVVTAADDGAAGSIVTFIGANAATTIIQGTPVTNPYTLLLTNASYTRWTNLTIIGIGGEWAFRVYDNSDYNEIDHCIITGDQYSIDVIDNGGGAPEYNRIHDNTMQSAWVGIRFKYGAASNQLYDNNIRVQSAGLVYSSVEMQFAYNNQVYRNKISSSGNMAEGTVYVGHTSSGNVVTNNYITNETPAGGSYLNPGIEIDDNSSTTFIHNSIYTRGVCLHLDPTSGGPTVNMTTTNFTNNILYSLSNNCLHIPRADVAFQNCNNNLYYAPGAGGNVVSENGVALTYAGWIASGPGGSNETNGLYGNPDYTNPNAGNLDLLSSSVAIDAVYIASVPHDIYLTARPQGPRSDIGAYETTVPMPVEMLNINLDCDPSGAVLHWTTAMEKDNDYFTIEVSIDGKSFEELTQISSAGNSTQPVSYSFHTYSPEAKMFRLSQTDIDGTVTNLSTLINTCSTNKETTVFSTSEGIYLQGDFSGDIQVNIYNVLAQKIYSGVYYANGYLLQEIGITLPEGNYMVEVITGSERKSFKVQK